MPKLKVCLTGGIASGKTYVSDQMALMGANIIDADILAREVVIKGSPGLAQLIDVFGERIIDQQGQLDRAELKSIVFTDKSQLAQLNSLLHPLIWQAFLNQSETNNSGIEVWVIPLFDINSRYTNFDRVLVVDVSTDTQISRMKNRDGIDKQVALSILDAQPSRKNRIKLATDVICNNGGFGLLEHNVKQIFNLYKGLEIRQIKSCS